MGSKLTDLTRITTVDTGDLIYIARTVGDTGVSAAMSRADFEDNLHVKLSLAQDTGKYLADSGFALSDTGQFLSDSGAFLSDSIITTLGRALIDDTGQTAMRSTLGLGTAAVKNTGTSGDAVPLLNAGNTFSASQTITLSNSFALPAQFISTAADAFAGPYLYLYRNSTSPAAGDTLGTISLRGQDSAGAQETYAEFFAEITTETATAESGKLRFTTVQAGVAGFRFDMGAGVYHPSSTGTDKGNNSINFGTIWRNGVEVNPSGIAKCWVQGTPNSTTIISSFNITSLGDTATGQQTVTIATDFASAAYAVVVTIGDTSTTLVGSATVMSKAAGSYVMNSVVEAGSGLDPTTDWNSVAFGAQ